jgi:hypothetical protein
VADDGEDVWPDSHSATNPERAMTATIGGLAVVMVTAKMSCHPLDLEARCVMVYCPRWVLRVLLFGAVMASLLVLAAGPAPASTVTVEAPTYAGRRVQKPGRHAAAS